MAFGLDFGTTNSSLAALLPDGTVRLARFHQGAGFTDAFRSLLYLEQIVSAGRKATKSWTGPQGIERYLAAEHKGRLIQSLKSFLSSRSLKNTEIFGRRAALEDLVASIARDLRLEAEKQFGVPIRRVVSGRPVRFVGSETPEDDDYAQARLEISLRKAGFEEIAFEFEPIGGLFL